jgi:hypothetical protein
MFSTFLSLRIEVWPRQRAHRRHHVQQFFYCCVCVRCRGRMFAEPLPSNGRLFWLRYSGFQASCYIASSFKAAQQVLRLSCWWEEFINYPVEMRSGAMIYIPSFSKIRKLAKKLRLCTTAHYGPSFYVVVQLHYFLALGIRWRWIVDFMHRPLHLCTIWWVNPTDGLDAVEKRVILPGRQSKPDSPISWSTAWSQKIIFRSMSTRNFHTVWIIFIYNFSRAQHGVVNEHLKFSLTDW